MVDRSVLRIAKRYLRALKLSGIHVRRAVLFGSHVRGTAAPDSDIDLVVVAPEFDPPRNEDLVDLLWESRGEADWRIEPFACGERQWETDDGNPLLEIVRREGKTIV